MSLRHRCDVAPLKTGDLVSGFLSAVLGSRGREHAAHFANQAAVYPQPAGLVEKIAHLRAHIAETRRLPQAGASSNGIGG